MKRIIIFFAVFFFSTAVATESYANFADTYGFSAKGIGRGNAVCAVVNDWSSVYYNIAGLGKASMKDVPGKSSKSTKKTIMDDKEGEDTPGRELNDEIAFTYLSGFPQIKIDIDRYTKADENLGTGAILVGLVIDLNHIYVLPEKIISSARFGLGMGVPDDTNLVKVNDVDSRTHDFMRYGREAERVVILAGAGFGFLDDMFGFGVGANVLMKGVGSVVMREAEIGPQEQTPLSEAKLDIKPAVAPVAGIYCEVGKILELFKISNIYTKNIKFGASYRGEIAMKIDPFDALAQTEIGNLELNIKLAIKDYYTPNIYTAGAGYIFPVPIPFLKYTLQTEFTFDCEYQMWSRHNVSQSRKKYMREAWGIEAPEFRDIIVYKTGLAGKAFSWLTVSTGYYYQPYFVPSEANKGVFNFLDNDKHVASLGLEFIIPAYFDMVSPVTVNLAGQYQYLKERKVTKYSPTPENPDYKYGGVNYLGILEVIFKW